MSGCSLDDPHLTHGHARHLGQWPSQLSPIDTALCYIFHHPRLPVGKGGLTKHVRHPSHPIIQSSTQPSI